MCGSKPVVGIVKRGADLDGILEMTDSILQSVLTLGDKAKIEMHLGALDARLQGFLTDLTHPIIIGQVHVGLAEVHVEDGCTRIDGDRFLYQPHADCRSDRARTAV